MEQKNEWHHVATMEDLGNLKRKIHVIYDTDGVKMALDKACGLVNKKVQIKGFRRGKAPKQLVENYYREEIEKYASTMLSQEGFLHACFENKIQPLGEPDVENSMFNIDGTFSCDIVLEVKPTIEPTGYVGLQLTEPKVNVSEIRDNLENKARTECMKEVNIEEVELGSIVDIDYTVKCEGNVISEGNNQFLIGEGQEPPFGENLVGERVGNSLIEEIILPEQMKDGGKQAEVNMTIKSAFRKELPNNDELVAIMDAPSYEDLMEAFNTRAEKEAKNKRLQTLEEEAVGKLIELHEFDIPDGWADDEEKYLISQLGLTGNIEDNIKTHIRNMAERNVKRTFILEAIYDAEPSLKVNKEEFDAWIEKEASNRDLSPAVLRNELKEKNMLDGVFGLIKHRKVLEFIIDNANIEK